MKEYSIDQLFALRWEDLTAKQLIKIVSLSDQLMNAEADSIQYGLLSIETLRTLRTNKAAVANLNVEQAVDCFNDITFFRRDEKGNFVTPWYFFPIKNFLVNGVEFEAPHMNGSLPMYNRSFNQLVYADSSFSAFCVLNHRYNQIKDFGDKKELKELERDMDQAINSLIAVLYIDHIDFDIERVEVNARLVPLKLTTAERAIILHTYGNVREFIVARCATLFSKPPEDPAIAVQPIHTGPMWLNLRYDLAETEVFKGFDKASKALVYDALDYLEKRAAEKPKPDA